MNPENSLNGFHSRLVELIGEEQPYAWAKRIGVPSATFDRMWRENAIPKAPHLVRIAASCGVSLDWLITGNEASGPTNPTATPPEPQPPAQPSAIPQYQPLDEDLHASIADGISKVYRDANARLSPADIGRLSARMHGELIDLYDDPADRAVGLKALLRQLQRDLQAPPGKSDKRSA